MTLEKAIRLLTATVEKAEHLVFVDDPVAWALYHVWKDADAQARKRRGDGGTNEGIVRCKDCKHRDPEDHKCDCGALEHQGCQFPTRDDYFCADGERKDGASE